MSALRIGPAGAFFHVVSPMFGFVASARSEMSWAAVFPWIAQCNLFCTVAKNFWAASVSAS